MWKQDDNFLYRLFQFRDFSEAFSFMANIALLAEEFNHHPTFINTYNKVEIKLTTHDAKDTVTEKDWQLAKNIDKLYSNNFETA
jgi:4a-hydroxytetrahydrobiopterin dehydratase